MKLFTRGLLLIAVPSAVELALLGVVFDTQEQTAQAAQWVNNSRQILYQSSALVDPLLREAARVRTAMAIGDASLIDHQAVWVDLADRLSKLDALVSDTPQQVERVRNMQRAVDAYREQTAAISTALHQGRSVKSYVALETSALPKQIAQVRDELAAFGDEAARLDTERSAALTRRRDRQQYALIAAVLGSMLIWAATAVSFARSIGRRLEVLTDNAERLGSGRPLAAPLSGRDEIAALDAVLHQTDARLREADHEQVMLKTRLEARARELAGVNEALRQETQDNEMFIYSVSHDLRSPLVNLQGFSKELQMSCDELDSIVGQAGLPEAEHRRMVHILDGDARESLHYLRSAVMRAAAIIDALLRISRAGRLEYHWQRVSVGRVVGRVVDALQGPISQRAAVVTVRELPPAWGDPAALEQIFSNLIGNALNFLDPARHGRIEVGALEPEAVDETGPGAVRMRTYYVRDNGLGIPAAYVSKVFRAFQRLHGEVATGDGIGLAVVRRTVERHGGRVWVESAEGAGSTFFVVLPEQPMRV
ncbi:putative periplasmic sensor signal transduction histidine kinase [Paraburkholderia ribeironis]|uniref:histidine kinase n=1 Tax=Paraburkholderia ribeironis TaxID=1247936 RepID=A0A1N7SEV5_9BURK|nr:ATP-binding protein [Paraburkholderia ribeironis]SIT45923.1 putative periplasmic sensor signal transduction histidine kinase [Paraburkholderia ribeironis]